MITVLKETLKKWDLFERPVPSLNLKGKETIRTLTGSILSLVLRSIMVIFGLLKLNHLLSRHNPTINTFLEEDAFEDGANFDTAKNDFNLAFALTQVTGKQKPIDSE